MACPVDVELREVTKSFAGTIAVDRASLRVERGEFFSLLGPSGCGKTTTLRMIAGFEHPTAGEVAIQGRVMGQTPPFARDVNTVFQHYALFPHMTVAENVAFGLQMKRVPKAEIARRVAEALALVRLGGFAERRPKQLSGGQQQRVALARALVNRPAVLLLDEPLGALDLKLRRAMQLELKRLQETVGITFVYVTHDQEEALTMSDRIAVMGEGRVAQVGPPDEVYERPATRFVADFIGQANFLEGEVREVREDRAVVTVDGAGPVVVPPARTGGAMRPGARVTVAVRPEKMRLDVPEAGRDGRVNGLRGTVDELLYTGTDTFVLVRVSGRHLLRVRQQNAEPVAHVAKPTPGSEVMVTWARESGTLLTA